MTYNIISMINLYIVPSLNTTHCFNFVSLEIQKRVSTSCSMRNGTSISTRAGVTTWVAPSSCPNLWRSSRLILTSPANSFFLSCMRSVLMQLALSSCGLATLMSTWRVSHNTTHKASLDISNIYTATTDYFQFRCLG